MKKSNIILAALMVLSCSFMSVEAEEITEDGTANLTITRTIPSTYSVNIPKVIELGTADNKNFKVSVTGNIAPDKLLKVSATSKVPMSRQGDSTYSNNATLSFGEISMNHNTLEKGMDAGGSISFSETKAGIYSGVAIFNISLETIAE